MTTVFQLGSVSVFKDMVFGWSATMDDKTLHVFNCSNPVALREIIRIFRDNPTMAKTMGDFFEVAEERISILEVKEVTEKIVQECAKAKMKLNKLRAEEESLQILIKRMDNRGALLSLIKLPGEWVTAPFTGHHTEDSLGDFVRTLSIEGDMLISYSPVATGDKPYKTAWINMKTLMSSDHIDNGEMVQYQDKSRGDAIYAWCKRTMERFW